MTSRGILLPVLLAGLLPLSLAAQVDHYETFVHEDSVWQYIIPSAEPDSNWTLSTYDASAWNNGRGGIGYGDGDDTTVVPACISVYMRMMFDVPDTTHIAFGLLDIDYDDGFVAFLNGVEIARSGLSGSTVPYDALADPTHEAVMYDGGLPERFMIPGYLIDTLLRTDSNVVAIQVHNSSATSSDLSMRPWLTLAVLDTADHGGTVPPSWFSEPVQLDSTLLPLVVIEAGTYIPNEPKVTANVRVIYNGEGQYQHVTDPGNVYAGRAGVERRGTESLNYPQPSYALQFRDSADVDLDTSLLGMPAEHDWVLLNTWNDKSFARNVLAFETSRHMGQYAPRMRLAEVVTDNDYKGIALLGERIKRDAQRVAITRLNTTDVNGDAVTGGYIWKVDNWVWGQGWFSNFSPIDHPGYDVRFLGFYPRLADINEYQTHYLKDRVHDFEEALYSDDYADPVLGYRPYIDVKSFIDFFLVNELARNEEGFNRSRFFHKDRDSVDPRIKAGPVWDFDHGWKNLTTCALFDNTDGSGWAHLINDCDPSVRSPGYYVRMLQDTLFASQVGCSWQSYRSTFLTEAWLDNIVDSMAALASSAQARYFAKYPTIGANNGTPEVEPVPTTWQGEVDALKAWISVRLQWLDANLPACTELGLAEQQAPTTVNAYPVPATDRVHVSGTLRGALQMELLDLNGRMMRTFQEHALPATLDLNGLVTGVFALRITTADGGATVLRIIHQ